MPGGHAVHANQDISPKMSETPVFDLDKPFSKASFQKLTKISDN